MKNFKLDLLLDYYKILRDRKNFHAEHLHGQALLTLIISTVVSITSFMNNSALEKVVPYTPIVVVVIACFLLREQMYVKILGDALREYEKAINDDLGRPLLDLESKLYNLPKQSVASAIQTYYLVALAGFAMVVAIWLGTRMFFKQSPPLETADAWIRSIAMLLIYGFLLGNSMAAYFAGTKTKLYSPTDAGQ